MKHGLRGWQPQQVTKRKVVSPWPFLGPRGCQASFSGSLAEGSLESQIPCHAGDAAPVLHMMKWEWSWILCTCPSLLTRTWSAWIWKQPQGLASFLLLFCSSSSWLETSESKPTFTVYTTLTFFPLWQTILTILRIISNSLLRYTLYALKFTHLLIRSHTQPTQPSLRTPPPSAPSPGLRQLPIYFGLYSFAFSRNFV